MVAESRVRYAYRWSDSAPTLPCLRVEAGLFPMSLQVVLLPLLLTLSSLYIVCICICLSLNFLSTPIAWIQYEGLFAARTGCQKCCITTHGCKSKDQEDLSTKPWHSLINLLQPTSTVVPRSHPDFSRKLKHLQQSDPVNPKDLAQRLELFLAEQSAYPDGIVPRRVRRPQTSSTNSKSTSGPPTPPQDVQRNSYLPESLRHNLDGQEFVDHAAGNHFAPPSKQPESVVENFAYPIPVAVLSPPSARHSTDISDDPALSLTTTLSAKFPAPPRSSRIGPLKADTLPSQHETIPFIGGEADFRQRPESTAYIPQTPGSQLVQTTSPIAANRASIQMVPQHADEQAFESLPFLTLVPLSPLQNTFSNNAPHNTVVNSPGLSTLSPGARTSIATESTFANYLTAPTSPASPPINYVNSPIAPAVDVTSRLEKRKPWHPRNLMASMKPTRSQSDDRIQKEFETTAVMVEAARQGQAQEGKIHPRPKSTACENLSVGTFLVPDNRPGTGGVPPMPSLSQSSTKVVNQGKETPVKESIWNRRSRRKTTGAQEAEKLKYVSTSMPTADKLRWKQLAMREKALADSKRAKGDRTTSSKPPIQGTEKPNMDQLTTVPAVYNPKKRFTLSSKVDLPPTTSTQAFRPGDLSPPTLYNPRNLGKPQGRPHSPVEVLSVSRPEGQDHPERSNSDSSSTKFSPIALSMGVSSLPRGVHLLDDTPTTDPFLENTDRDARALGPTSPAAESKSDTVQRPKLLLGPFPTSNPASPSSSPPNKPLPQPPRFAPVQQNPYKQQSPTRFAPADQKPYKQQSPTKTAPAEQLRSWDQPMLLDVPSSLDYTTSASPTHEQRQPKHAREISITKVVAAPRMISSPASSPALEISSPQEIAKWEIFPPREAPAPRDNMSSSLEQKSPIATQLSDFGPQSRNDETTSQTTRSRLDRQRSQPVLNQYGEPPHRPRALSIDAKTSFDPSKTTASRVTLNALRPKTSSGLPAMPLYTIEVRDNEIAEMTPASVKLLREQQSLLRRRALAAAGHSDPDAAMRRSPIPLGELRDRARGTNRSFTTASNKATSRSSSPLTGPGSSQQPHSSRDFIDPAPHVSVDRQGRIQTHLGNGAAERKSICSPADSHRQTPLSTSQNSSVRKKSVPESVMLSSRAPSTMHSSKTSISISGVPHVSGSQMAEEMKVEREREIDATRAMYGLPAKGAVSNPIVGEKFGAADGGDERTEAERAMTRKRRDKWWKIWRAV